VFDDPVIRSLSLALTVGVVVALGIVAVRTYAAVAAGHGLQLRSHLATARLAYVVLLATILLWPKPGWHGGYGHWRPLRYSLHQFTKWPPNPREFALNVLLLVPLGVLLVLGQRARLRFGGALLVLPFASEAAQAFVGYLHRAATAADVVAYVIGITAGALLATAATTVAPRSSP
jgi:glycopeptide antibiotics resistance protein